jgi:hypothetical protein
MDKNGWKRMERMDSKGWNGWNGLAHDRSGSIGQCLLLAVEGVPWLIGEVNVGCFDSTE